MFSVKKLRLQIRRNYTKTMNNPLLKLYSQVISVAHGLCCKYTNILNKTRKKLKTL